MFNKDIGDKYCRALVFGTGGGNDIVSAVLAAMYLNKHGIEVDVGGILSPAALHTFSGHPEKVVNRLEGDIRRFLPARDAVEISFIDAALPGHARGLGIPVNGFYDFSIRFGTSALVDGLEELVAGNGYDLVVAVDVGGDILARGAQDPTVMSPVMDFTSLYAVGQLGVDTLLVEFGLGTDGELRPQGMQEIVQELQDKDLQVHEGMIKGSDPEVGLFRDLFDKVAQTRRGHTATMTLATLDTSTPDEDLVSDYSSTYRIGKKKWVRTFPITLPHQTFGKTYVIDAKGLAQHRTGTAFAYDNPLEQYIRLKKLPEWKTELDIHHIWSGDGWTMQGPGAYCMHLMALSTLWPAETRKDILMEGAGYMRKGMCDANLVLSSDLACFDYGGLSLTPAGDFVIVSTIRSDPAGQQFLKETASLIEKYQK